MGKYGFWILLGLVAWFAYKLVSSRERDQNARERARERAQSEQVSKEQARKSNDEKNANQGLQEVEPCAHCQVYFPKAQALANADGLLFCSAVHRDAGPRKSGKRWWAPRS
jgi:uncharacterized protein